MASKQEQKTISLKNLLDKYRSKLPRQELESLLALTLHKKAEYIYKNPDKKIALSSIKTFKKLLNKRLAHYSLAYLKKNKDFYKNNFIVSKHTLVPRPASETLVEEALRYANQTAGGNKNILDIGTGSGALILSIAKHNQTQANYTAIDISTKALKIAKTNARKLGLKNKIRFIKSDLLKNINNDFDIIIANLPYLNKDQMKETSIAKEPKSALFSGPDGLSHYKKLLKQLKKLPSLLLLEIDPSQKEAIKKIIEQQWPDAKINFIKDLNQDIRVVKITQQ